MKIEVDVNAGDLFESIDVLCKKEATIIRDFINSKSIFVSDIFILQDNASKLNHITAKNTDVGIYIFMVAANVPLNGIGVANFDSVSYAAKTNNNFKGASFTANDCLYVGKAETKLYKRIEEHTDVPSGIKTYSLRLGTKERQHVKGSLCLYTFILKKEFKKYKKVLLPIVEGYLHDFMLPKAGSKRA